MSDHQYRQNYERRQRNWRNDPELIRVHHASLTVACRYCHQPVGKVCIRLDEPGYPELVNLPCHPVRETDSTRGPKQL